MTTNSKIMVKRLSGTLWQKAHKDKVKEYQNAYMKDKTQASVVLDAWVVEEIDKMKEPGQSYGNWVRRLVEDWAENQKQQQV